MYIYLGLETHGDPFIFILQTGDPFIRKCCSSRLPILVCFKMEVTQKTYEKVISAKTHFGSFLVFYKDGGFD